MQEVTGSIKQELILFENICSCIFHWLTLQIF